MDIDLIRTFIQVAKTSHFRKAAEQLFLTPSAISARIKLLEERIGVQLLNRNKHDVSLTTAGVRFLVRAEKMMELWAHACQEALLTDPAESTIVVGATDTIWSIFLTDWIVEMRRKYPALAIQAELHTAASLMPGLLNGAVDIAVMFDVPALPRLAIRELATVELVMVSSCKGVNAVDAVGTEYIAVDWGDTFASVLDQHFGTGIGGHLRTSVGSVACELLLKSGGSAYLPAPMVAAGVKQKQLFKVADAPVISRPVYTARLAGGGRENEAIAAIDVMAACLKRLV